MSIVTQALRWVLPFIALSVQAEPLYWSATNGKVALTIIGSVHVGDPSMYPLPEALYQTLKESDGLIVESDTSQKQHIIYPKNTINAEQALSKEQMLTLNKIAEEFKLQSSQISKLPPWSAALTLQFLQLQKLGYKAQDGVDLHLMNHAIDNHIPLVPLETMQFQMDLLTKQPQDGKEMLVSIIDEWESNKNMTQCMIKSWKAGDEKNLTKMMHLSEMSPEMEQAFVHSRNQDWAEKLSSKTFLPNPNGQYVMIVGALHLVGDQNLLDLLQKRGFKVSQLNTSKEAQCDFF